MLGCITQKSQATNGAATAMTPRPPSHARQALGQPDQGAMTRTSSSQRGQ